MQHICEEASEIEFTDYLEIDRRLRGYQGRNKNGSKKYMQIMISFNPITALHWLKTHFVDRDYPHVLLTGEKQSVEFRENLRQYECLIIRTTYKDNHYIDSSYAKQMEDLKLINEHDYQVYSLGEWGTVGGSYFSEFRSGIHVINPFSIPEHWKRFISLDYGLDMTSCCWWTIAPDGMEYIYKEFNQKDLILSQAAKEILNRIEPGEKISYIVASPDLWNRRQDSGDSGQEIMYKAGLKGLIKADNRRVEGWRNLKEHLFIYEDIEHKEVATLRLFSTCRKTIDSIQNVQTDKHDPEDVSDEPHEYTHAVENIRYGAFSRPRPNKVAETFVQPAGTMSRLAEEQLRNIEKRRKTKNFV